MPDRAAAAELPPFPSPGLGGHLHGLVLEALGRVAGHHIPAPRLLAGLHVIGGDIAARRAVVGAAEADHDLVACHPWRAGDIAMLRLVQRLDRPARLAGFGIDGDQPTVACGGEDHAVLIGNAARAPARAHPRLRLWLARDIGVILPQQLPSARIHRVDHTMADCEIEDPVDRQRLRVGIECVEILIPGETEIADIRVGDLGERAIMLFAGTAAEAVPVDLRLTGRAAPVGCKDYARARGQSHCAGQHRYALALHI